MVCGRPYNTDQNTSSIRPPYRIYKQVTPLPVCLGILGQVLEGGVKVHEAGGLIHHPPGWQPARPAEDPRYPDTPLPGSHGLPPCRDGETSIWMTPPHIHRLYTEMLSCYRNVLMVVGCQWLGHHTICSYIDICSITAKTHPSSERKAHPLNTRSHDWMNCSHSDCIRATLRKKNFHKNTKTLRE